MTVTNRTRDQELAKYAADCIARVGTEQKDIARVGTEQKEFKSLVRNFPAMIMTSGLGQALAFLKAKNEKQHEDLCESVSKHEDPHKGLYESVSKHEGPHKDLYKFVSEWVSEKIYAKKTGDVLPLIIESDSLHYRQALQETMDLATWLKRFAEAQFSD